MDQKISNIADSQIHSSQMPESRNAAIATVLSNTSFRTLWFGQVCSQLSISTLMFVLALRVYQETGSTAAVSGIYLTFGIPSFIFGMGAGAIVDHFDKRFLLFWSDIARSVLGLGFFFALSNIPLIYVFAFLSAVVTQFAVPSEATSIPRLVPSQQLVTANSMFSFTFYSSLAIGSLLSGPLLRIFGPSGIFLFISCMFMVAAYNVYHLPIEADKRQRIPRITFKTFRWYAMRVIHSIRDGITYTKTNSILTDAIILLTGTQVILGLLATLGPAFVDKTLHVDVHDAALVLIGPAVIGIVIGALWVGNYGFRLGPNRLIRWGVLSAGILLMIVPVVASLRFNEVFSHILPQSTVVWIVFTLFFLLGLANSMLDVPANSILQKEAEGPMRGRVYGMLTTAVGGLGILPAVVSGILADMIGVEKVVLLLGILVTVYGIARNRHSVKTS